MAIKVAGDTNETTRHIPDGLSEMAALALKKETALSWGWSDWTSHPLDAAEEKWTLEGGIEVPFIYRFYGLEKSKAKFRNEVSK